MVARGRKASHQPPRPRGTAVVIRAEISSPTTFTVVSDTKISPSVLQAFISEVRLGLPDGAEHALRNQLYATGCCELDASSYVAFNKALFVATQRHVAGVFWIPLPGWVADSLPAFGGKDWGRPPPSHFWLPEGLMPYQQLSIQRALAQDGRVLLADEMGLGKTAQALSIIAQFLENEGPALIVTPASIGSVWKEQAARWLPNLCAREVQLMLGIQDRQLPQARLVIMSYTLFSRQPKIYSQMSNGDAWRVVVCDEAHYLRNPTSQRAKALLPVLHAATRAVLVTGTPTPKQASEAFTLVHALRPLKCTFPEWCSRYGSSQTEHREAEVATLLSEVMVRRVKADVLEQLPPRHRQRISVQLPASASATLRRLQTQSMGEEEHFNELAFLKQTVAQDYVEYLIDASSEKFLLFAHHIAMLDALSETLGKRAVEHIRIDGSTPVMERAGLVNRFQTDPRCRVAVLSVIAAGEGLTLTAAALCVFCELYPAVPGVIEQAEARIHRIGQKASRVDTHFLVLEGTYDESVFARLESRTDEVALAVGDVDAQSGIDSVTEASPVLKDAAPADGLQRAQPETQPDRPLVGMEELNGVCPPKRKRRRPGLDLGSMLDNQISQVQAEMNGSDVGSARGSASKPQTPVLPASASTPCKPAPATSSTQAIPRSRRQQRKRCIASSDEDQPSAGPHAVIADASSLRAGQDEDMMLKLMASHFDQTSAEDNSGSHDDEPREVQPPQVGAADHGAVGCHGETASTCTETGSRGADCEPAASSTAGIAESKEDPLSAMLDMLIDSARANCS